MDENRKKIINFLAYLKKHAEDRGLMANLRQGFNFNSDSERRAWPHIAVRCDLTKSRERTVWATIGAAFATLKGDMTNTGNLGSTLRQIALVGASGSAQDALKSFDARFRRLLTCDTAEEVCARLPGIIRAAKDKGIGVNLEKLFCDLIYWHEHVKLHWAGAYWGASAETPDEKSEEGI